MLFIFFYKLCVSKNLHVVTLFPPINKVEASRKLSAPMALLLQAPIIRHFAFSPIFSSPLGLK